MTNDKNKDIFDDDEIVIDQEKNLIFQTEEDVLAHFKDPIKLLEDEYLKKRSKKDFSDTDAMDYESELESLLGEPDEIWQDSSRFDDFPVFNYIKKCRIDGQDFFYVAVTYLSNKVPTFIFLHFPTRVEELRDFYKRGEKIYDQSEEQASRGGVEGDALSEGDDLARGLYNAMLTLRSEEDIPEKEFHDYGELREDAIEDADEIWRSTSLAGYTLVTFIKELTPTDVTDESLYYCAVTIEDEATNSHSLLFSFPSQDENLVDRYRHGENLQADEVIQESSH